MSTIAFLTLPGNLSPTMRIKGPAISAHVEALGGTVGLSLPPVILTA